MLCLKWEPRIVRLNSATFDTTKLVPNSVQLINWVDFVSLIILHDERSYATWHRINELTGIIW